MAFAESFLIYPQLAHQIRWAPFQTTLDRAFHDAVDLVPTEL